MKIKRLAFSEAADFGLDFGPDNAGGGSPEGAATETPEFDFSKFGVEDPAPTGQPQTQAEEVKHNAAWDPILQNIPTALHGQITPHLKEWDRNYNAKAEEAAELRKKYEPFQGILDSGVDPRFMQVSLAMAQDLQRDPVAFLEDLKSRLIQAGRYQEAAAVQQAQNEADPNANEGAEPDPYQQQMQQLSQGQEALAQQMRDFAQQQQYAQNYAQAEAEFEQSFQNIETAVGQKLSEPMKQRIVQEAIILEQQLGRPASLEEGFQSLQRFLGQAQQARRQAPRVLSGNGGGHKAPEVPDMATNKDARKSHMLGFLQG